MTESRSIISRNDQMDQNALLSTLSALADQGVKRTKIGQLRELLPQVEAAQRAGYSNEAIARALTERGLALSKKSLETMLYRLRKDAAPSPNPPGSLAAASPPSQPTTAPASPPVRPTGQPRITTPTHIRQSRNRDVDLNQYLDDSEGNK